MAEVIDGRTKAGRLARAQRGAVASGASIDAPEFEAAPRAPAAPSRRVSRETPREAMRTNPRGASEAIGRDGKVLSRKRTQSKDIFDIPKELIEPGWEFQWCAVSVVGNTELLMDQNLMFAENGWRPVNADRFPGRFMPVGYKGSITRGGQMLMERPKRLSDEARAEDIAAARQLISDRNESLKLTGVKRDLKDGYEMGGRYRGTGGNIKLSIDPALDAPQPEHILEND